MEYRAILQLIKDQEIKFVDLRFTDILNIEHNITIPSYEFNTNLTIHGKEIDTSAITAYQDRELTLLPQLTTTTIDPFAEYNTLVINCNISKDKKKYDKCLRSIAKDAEDFLKSTNIGDSAHFGITNEFFVFDSVRWGYSAEKSLSEIDAEDASWSSDKNIDGGNMGHRANSLFNLSPIDTLYDFRSDICQTLAQLNISVLSHKYKRTAQCEIEFAKNSLLKNADLCQLVRHTIKNCANRIGKSATFMPNPILNGANSGLLIDQAIYKNNTNILLDNEIRSYYMGGIIKHIHAINAFTNPTINSYKRLASCNLDQDVKLTFPDAMANMYLIQSIILIAGIDGVINKIKPQTYSYSKSLAMSLDSLDKDRSFLSSVFSDNLIDSFIKLKLHEVELYNTMIHPLEFAMYYSI